VTRVTITIAVWVLPSVALASGSAGQPEGWYGDLAFHAFNLAFFVGLVGYLAKGVISDALKNRSATIQKDLEESNRLRREAQARYDELEARLTRFEAEFDELRAEAGKASLREVDMIQDRAAQEVAQIKEGAQTAIRDEVSAARTALHQHAVSLAMQVAEEQLRNRISSADQNRLAQDLLGSMKEANGHG
jgi:F-type H+-transporting ATPase subunit b